MKAILKVMAAAAALAMASPAFAQDNLLTYSGVTFDARGGWCPRQVMANGAMTLEFRLCGDQNRYASVLKMQPAAEQPYDVAAMAKTAWEYLEGPEGKTLIESAMNAGYGSCVAQDIVIGRNPVSGISGFEFTASGMCTKDGKTEQVDFANYSAYAVGKDGALWSIAFDHPHAAITADEAALLRALVTRIGGN